MVPPKSIATLANAFIARFDAGTTKHLAPHLPADLRDVPRANMTFVPIKDAWFSGFMNYVGRARNADGSPQYEATYEINASLQISVPEFEQLVGHEVVPGHVTTAALMQGLYVRGRVGFEATILAMNTRWGTLAEGIGNNAVLMAMGADGGRAGAGRGPADRPLARAPPGRREEPVLVPDLERAARRRRRSPRRCGATSSSPRSAPASSSGAWGRHPLFGRMNLPAYRAGTEVVAELRRRYPPEKVLPALYGCAGLVDVVTVRDAVKAAR